MSPRLTKPSSSHARPSSPRYHHADIRSLPRPERSPTTQQDDEFEVIEKITSTRPVPGPSTMWGTEQDVELVEDTVAYNEPGRSTSPPDEPSPEPEKGWKASLRRGWAKGVRRVKNVIAKANANENGNGNGNDKGVVTKAKGKGRITAKGQEIRQGNLPLKAKLLRGMGLGMEYPVHLEGMQDGHGERDEGDLGDVEDRYEIERERWGEEGEEGEEGALGWDWLKD